ncbi:hypothetical protein [Psychrobacter sp. UBA3068]|jgi:septal ring-binding cell division protein DamX|uniref:hypothetical protein n=1 Tax=Psychrobacter sp. UBA3068 TaxID=1947349 RepID=UPI00257EDE06|nr:hypothetical protein [Psychrobacter sp. UBA3068]
MTTKPLSLPRLPIILATGVLSTSLLLSGCSNNDTVEPEVDTENTAAVTANNTDTDNQAPTVSADNTVENETIADPVTDEAIIDNDDLSPVASSTEQKSLVTNPTQSGTPEDTVKQALDSLYYGDAKKAAEYYKVDMANFEEELAKTQSAFRQTVDGVTITDTKYNEDKTRATIVGELMLKGQSEPAPLTYELQKIAGQWKILG